MNDDSSIQVPPALYMVEGQPSGSCLIMRPSKLDRLPIIYNDQFSFNPAQLEFFGLPHNLNSLDTPSPTILIIFQLEYFSTFNGIALNSYNNKIGKHYQYLSFVTITLPFD